MGFINNSANQGLKEKKQNCSWWSVQSWFRLVSSQKIGVNSTQTRQVLETCWVFPRIIEYVLRLAFILVAIIMLSLAVEPLYAQSPSIVAEIDRDRISIDETVILTIIVTGQINSPPTLPTLDFDIIGTSRGSQISIINGNMTTQSTYSFTLEPRRVGDLEINPITVEIDGQTYRTSSIRVKVSQGSAPVLPTVVPADPAAGATSLEGQDFFVEAEVDNLSPYLSQQVTYTFRFYQAVNLRSQPTYDAPDFAGFWNQHETQQSTYTIEAANRTYRVTELQTILFPTVVGERTIKPAQLAIAGSYFEPGESLYTELIKLDVQALPAPQPDTFRGAVGQFDISASVEPTEVDVNEPITLRVTVEGQGNVDTFPPPELPELDDWRVFEATSSTNSELRDAYLFGSRVDEQLWIPSKGGQYTIPAITYTYFDPDTQTYETANTEPIPVNVIGEEAQEEPVAAPTVASAPSAPSAPNPAHSVAEPLNVDIRHIKPVPAVLTAARPSLISRLNYRIAWVMPLLLFVIHFVWQWQRQQLAANPSLIRRSRAHKNARHILEQARKQKSDLYTAINQALTGYLSDKLDQPIKGLTQNALVDLLQQKGLEPSLTEHVNDILMESERGSFAPKGMKGGKAESLVKQTEKLLADLERGLS